MYIVEDDQPDVPFGIMQPTVTDAEGNPVDAGALSFEVLSTDADVVAVTQDSADPLKGNMHFGKPGVASVNCLVKRASDGLVLGSFGAQFTVTAGDPAAILGGSIAFDGLTEAPGN